MILKRGCLISAFLVLLAGIIGLSRYVLSQPTHREPEIPIDLLVKNQLTILGSEWSYVNPSWLYTNDDATRGTHTVWLSLRHSSFRKKIRQEFHVFPSALSARINQYASPATLNVEDDHVPIDWSYYPPHADWFILDCQPIDSPDFCRFIVRYEEYVIYFSAPIEGYLTLEQLKEVIEVTDNTMHQFLVNSTFEPGGGEIPVEREIEIQVD